MAPTAPGRTLLGVYLDPAQARRLRRYARGVAGSVSGLVAAAVCEYLDARADAEGAPRPDTDPLPRRRRRRGRPSTEEAAAQQSWQEEWRDRVGRQRGRRLGSDEGAGSGPDGPESRRGRGSPVGR